MMFVIRVSFFGGKEIRAKRAGMCRPSANLDCESVNRSMGRYILMSSCELIQAILLSIYAVKCFQ